MLTRDLLNELFWYDEEIGQLRWKIKTSNRVAVNSIAGTIHESGCRQIPINGKIRKAHRLIWMMFIGEIPESYLIDHIDGNRDNNHLENLRLATVNQNQHNTKLRKDSISGVKGVGLHKPSGLWRGRIRVDGVLYQKLFETREETEVFVRQKREEIHGEFANHGIHKCNLRKA